MADKMQSPEDAGAERESVPNDAQTVPKAPDSPTARGDTSRTAKSKALEEVGDLSDFPEGSHKVVKVGGRQIGILTSGGSSTDCLTFARTRPGRFARRRSYPVP